MRTPGDTLISRIVLTTLAVTAIAMTAMVLVVVVVLDFAANRSVDTTLHERLDAVSATVTTSPSGALKELQTPDDDIDDSTWIFDSSGSQVEGPRAGKKVQSRARTLADVRRETGFESHDRVYLAAPVRDRPSGKVIAVVVVTESMAPYETTRIAVVIVLVTVGLAVTGGSAAIAAWTVRRTLAPVESMARRAEEWSERDLDSRFESTDADDEFGRLGRTLNVLLDRVARALRSEQQLTSELAHELRTPLSAIRGDAELGVMTTTDPDLRERFGRVIDVVDRMSTTIASLLAIARDSPRSDARTTVDALVVTTLEHLDTSRVDVRNRVGPVEIAVSNELAVRALGPIVENALRHAASSVTFTAETHERRVDITVSDDGEGLDDTVDSESVFASGHRGPRSEGAGLGLALARRIARTLGGDVQLTSASDPTNFTLSLPRT